jgi:hypothetical protein
MNKRLLLFAVLLMLPVLVLAGYGMPSPGGASAASLAPSTGTVLDALEETLGGIYEQVNPSVVNIQVVVEQEGMCPQSFQRFPDFPLDRLSPRGRRSSEAWALVLCGTRKGTL